MKIQNRRTPSIISWDEFFQTYPTEHTLTNIRNQATWLLPQLMALLGHITKPYFDSHKDISFSSLIQFLGSEKLTYVEGDFLSRDSLVGLLRVLNHCPRGQILAPQWKQYSQECHRWNTSVPLILSAFKQYNNIKYSSWDYTDPNSKWFLDKDFLEYSKYFKVELPLWQESDYLEFRQTSCLYRSGDKAGTYRSPQSTTSVTKVDDKDFIALPRLLKLSLTQLWVFSPGNYDAKYAITNNLNLDTPGVPLVGSELISPIKDTPWESDAKLDTPW